MTKLEKWNKGIYYSCPHQEKSQTKCVACSQKLETNKRMFPDSVRGTNLTSFNCIICKGLGIAELSKEFNSEEEKLEVKVDECYLNRKERDAVCSNCKDKYEKLILCPFCWKEKDKFGDNTCENCWRGKSSEEITAKSLEYKNQILNSSSLRINQENYSNTPEGAVPIPNNQQLATNQTQPSSKFNWKHPLVIGGISLAILALVGLIVYLISKNKGDK